MKIQKCRFENEDIIQVYLNKSENKDKNILKEINKLKKEYSNISIFISGEKDTVKTIKDILNYEKSKEIK